jgi:multidrug resistance efflux pump
MPTPAETSQVLSPAIRELLAVFERELAGVQFPNVDHRVLAELAAQVEGESERVETLRQQLDEAQATLADAQQKLVRTAELGLAYARVYAASDADLQARLADLQIGAGEAPRRRKLEVAAPAGAEGTLKLPPRRGRKPKQAAEDDATGT